MTKDGIGNYILVQSWRLFHWIISCNGLVNYLTFRYWLGPSALFNRNNSIHMTTFVSWRLNILCIMFKIIVVFITTLFARFYERVDILLTNGKHLHGRIISVRGGVWAHTTSLASPLFIEVHVPSQESVRSFLCVLRYRFSLFHRFWHLILELFRQCGIFCFSFILFPY